MHHQLIGMLLPHLALAQPAGGAPRPEVWEHALWELLLIVCSAGAVGGFINALLTDNGFVLPRSAPREKAAPGDPAPPDGAKIYRPGFLGNVLVGTIAAGISWGLYGPFATYVVFPLGGAAPGTPEPSLTMSALAGAVLVGVGGAKWLTNEVDKKLLKEAAAKAATKSAVGGAKAAEIALASPARALVIAQSLPEP